MSAQEASAIPSPVSEPPLTPLYPKQSNMPSEAHQDNASDDGSSIAEGAELPIAQRGRTFRRLGDPPRNAQGKMICNHEECKYLTFERRSEWSKHMDKHDRPYKCTAPGCELLQGFTYTGGLLRHEREVHKMHGGTKQPLFCPYGDCKRNSGVGFTRKENLAEHIRRVHRRPSDSPVKGSPSSTKGDDGASHGYRHGERPTSAPSGVKEPGSAESSKRKRRTGSNASSRSSDSESEEDDVGEGGGGEEADEADLRSEIKRLRKELDLKDERLKKLEAGFAKLSRSRDDKSPG